MPLSDHEQRLLDEIEQALYAEDPKFAASVRSARTRSRTRRVAAAVRPRRRSPASCLVLVGLITNIIALSVVGFVLVVGSCGYAAQVLRGRDRSTPTASDAGRPPAGQPGAAACAAGWKSGCAAASTRTEPAPSQATGSAPASAARSAAPPPARRRRTSRPGPATPARARARSRVRALRRTAARRSPGVSPSLSSAVSCAVPRPARSDAARRRAARASSGRGLPRVARQPLCHLARRAGRRPHVAQVDGGVGQLGPQRVGVAGPRGDQPSATAQQPGARPGSAPMPTRPAHPARSTAPGHSMSDDRGRGPGRGRSWWPRRRSTVTRRPRPCRLRLRDAVVVRRCG